MSNDSRPSQMGAKKVHVRERAFLAGDIIGVNAYHVKLDALKLRISEGGYRMRETPHFLVCERAGSPTLLVHWFPQDAIDSNIGHYLMEELKPLGMLANPQRYGDVFAAVVGSVFPHDNRRAWHLFATNTLQRYYQLLEAEQSLPDRTLPIETFATLYHRVQELCTGESLLDAGCSSGFLPLLLAERQSGLKNVTGVDIRAEPFAVAEEIARERHLENVYYKQVDLLADEMESSGPFDTVTALHVLEHFSEADMYAVLAKLLRLTARRLIIAVPYEEGAPEPTYGHEQLFTREKLEAVGRWCIEQWGAGRAYYEECAGGLVYLDRVGLGKAKVHFK